MRPVKFVSRNCFFLYIFIAIFILSSPVLAANYGLTLVYSGNLDGELEPCGCSEGGNKGGIKRRVQKVDELRAEEPNLLLISAGGLLISEMPQDKLKSEYILKGLEALDYDAIGVQWKDLARSLQVNIGRSAHALDGSSDLLLRLIIDET